MKSILTATAISAALMCGTLIAQSTSPSSTDAAATQSQPPANQPTAPQSQMQPTAQPPATSQPATGQPTSQPTTGPAGAAANQTSQAPKIAPGSVIPVQLTKTIDAKKAKTGDEVVAKVTMDMKTTSGEVLVPKDTKVVGHVTEAQARNKDQKESQMGIAFDRAELKDGQSINVPMSIQAVIGQQNNNNAQGGSDQGSSSPSAPGGATPNASASAGRPGMAGSTPQPSPSATAGADTTSNDSQAKNSTPRITGQTQGVVGISNLTLASGPNGAQGSVMSSEKNNVKLESGTMLLLKVNQ